MSLAPLPTIRKRQANKLANTNYVNEVADVVLGQSPFGKSGQRPDQVTWPRAVLVLVSDDGGDGSYKGAIVLEIVTDVKADASEAFSVNPFNPLENTPCIIWDLPENGRPGHRIPSGTYTIGFIVGLADDDTTPVVLVNYGRDSVFRVDLTKDGGADGDDNNPPTYTYSATYRDTSSAGDHIELLAQRPNGSFTPATIGVGHDSDDGFVLVWCDEIPVTDTCSAQMGEQVQQFYAAAAAAPQPSMTRYLAANFH